MANAVPARDLEELRARHKARARPNDGVREARLRLTQGNTLKPEHEYELILMFVRNELEAQATILLVAAIFAFASMFWAPWLQAILWLFLVIGTKVMLLVACRQFHALPRAEVDVGHWRRRFIALELMNGCVWAGFAMVGIGAGAAITPDYEFSSHVFLFASLIVVLAVRMTFASTVMAVLYVGTVPMTLAVVTRLVFLQDFFHVALASMAIGVHIYFMFLARGLNSTALAMLAYRTQKDMLIAELEEQKAISDEARSQSEAASIAKSRFLATMSHELRTPLNAILGFSEVMTGQIMGPMGNKTYLEYAGNIHQSGRHLLNLINEVLDLSRIEAGRYELHEEPVRLGDIIEDCHRLLKLKAEAKGLQIVESVQPDLPQLWADQRAVRQICLNLLSNAVKFTPRGGTVTMVARAGPAGGQILAVRDTGPGIPAEEIPKVLQAFGQGSLAHETAEGGTGLGLPIVKSLVELHGGRFELASQLRRGTEATAHFPAQRAMRSLAPLQPRGRERHREGPAEASADAPTAARGARSPRLRAARPPRAAAPA
jgi:two-component system cell cycle sensor histidine kinase PleC